MLNFEKIEISEDAQKQLNQQVESLIGSKVEEETSGMRTKLDELLSEAKTAKQKAKEAEEQKTAAAEEAARKNGDIESLDKSWSEKMLSQEAQYNEKINGLMATIRQDKVESVGIKLAAELSGEYSGAMLPHVLSRLDVEQIDGSYKTIVKDADGKRSALTVDELKAELMSNKALAPLIITSQASGAGAIGSLSTGGASGKQMTPAEKKAAEINKRLGR